MLGPQLEIEGFINRALRGGKAPAASPLPRQDPAASVVAQAFARLRLGSAPGIVAQPAFIRISARL
jgi:hypothetical protein